MNEKDVKIVKALDPKNKIQIYRVLEFSSEWFTVVLYSDFKESCFEDKEIRIHKTNVVICEELNGC